MDLFLKSSFPYFTLNKIWRPAECGPTQAYDIQSKKTQTDIGESFTIFTKNVLCSMCDVFSFFLKFNTDSSSKKCACPQSRKCIPSPQINNFHPNAVLSDTDSREKAENGKRQIWTCLKKRRKMKMSSVLHAPQRFVTVGVVSFFKQKNKMAFRTFISPC